MFRVLCSLVLILSFTGCMSKGFQRDQMFAKLDQQTEVSDKQIADVLSRKAQLPKPFTVAVYLESPRRRDFHYDETKWTWTEAEQQMIAEALEPLKQRNLVKQVAYIPPSLVDGNDLKSIRLAAAQHGADAVLVVKGMADVDSFNNSLAYSYILLLPALFVPGNHAKSLFITHAALWDVRNEFLYMTAEGDAEADQVRPAAFIDKEELVADAKKSSVKLLTDKLKDMSAHFDETKTAQIKN